jgi:hypothetical protein
MAINKTMISPNELQELSYKYIEDCMNFKKDHPTASGRIVQISDRQIPTIDYFLRIWIPKQGKPTICRKTYYNWLNGEDENKLHTIKEIEGLLKALATDIVANEGKGIFYAKNRLGMSDKAQNEVKFSEQPLFPDWLTKPII